MEADGVLFADMPESAEAQWALNSWPTPQCKTNNNQILQAENWLEGRHPTLPLPCSTPQLSS
jgi:hypothetical protein